MISAQHLGFYWAVRFWATLGGSHFHATETGYRISEAELRMFVSK